MEDAADDRLCRLAECGKKLVQKPGETRQNYKNRMFCDKACASKYPKRKRRGRGIMIPKAMKILR